MPQQQIAVPDWLARALRTFAQSFIATFLMLVVPPNFAPGYIPSWDNLTKAGYAALVAAAISLLTAIHNALEDNTSFPAILKPSPPAENPVPKPAEPPTSPGAPST